MAIIVDKSSKIIIQGITGKVGSAFAERMLQYGTPIVAGVTPGKGGATIHGLSVYNTVAEAVNLHRADTSFISVNPKFVKEAAFEAINAGIKVIVIYSEGVYVQDSVEIVNFAKLNGCMVLGPNSAGVVSPSKANVSDIHDSILKSGDIGIVSRSGTLTYEVVDALKQLDLGVSTIVCLGGDPVVGVSHSNVLELFEQDDETRAIVYVGEIGGNDEYLSAEFIKTMKKPVYSYIAGLHAPQDKRMGHAGAIINNISETAASKQVIMEEAGAVRINLITEFAKILVKT